MEWEIDNKINLKDFYGFIYKITLPDGQFYIGQKSLWLNKKKKVGKRELLKNGKSKFRKYRNKKGEWVYYKEEIVEAGWRDYFGSSKTDVISNFIAREGEDKIKREILKFTKNKRNSTYWEAYYLFKYDVLFNPKAINGNILGKFFKSNIDS